MIRSALIGLVGIVTILCYACSAPAPPPPPQTPGLQANCASPNVAELTFANGKHFQPSDYGNCTKSSCGYDDPHHFINPATQTEKAEIQQVFDAAPTFFKNELCRLDQIYIDTTHSGESDAWGMKEVRYGNRIHLGISSDLLNDIISSTTPFAFIEACIFDWLLTDYDIQKCGHPPKSLPKTKLPRGRVTNWVDGVTFAANPDSAPLALLDILAHEMGHVLWTSQVANYDTGSWATIACNASGIQYPNFWQYSWNSATYLPRRGTPVYGTRLDNLL